MKESIVLDPTVAQFGEDLRAADLGNTHFIGIGGAGMSVLAEMLHEQGVPVDGSDRERARKPSGWNHSAYRCNSPNAPRTCRMRRWWCIPARSSRTILRSSQPWPMAPNWCIAVTFSPCS